MNSISKEHLTHLVFDGHSSFGLSLGDYTGIDLGKIPPRGQTWERANAGDKTKSNSVNQGLFNPAERKGEAKEYTCV